MAVASHPFHDATVSSLLDDVAARFPDREALVLDDERVTFAEFRQRAEILARGLAALGLGAGDKVAIWLPNRPSWFIAQQACARIGAVVVALNPRYRTHELAYILAQSDSAALLLTDHLGPVDYLETLHDVLPELARSAPGELASDRFPLLRHVIVDAEDPVSRLPSPERRDGGGSRRRRRSPRHRRSPPTTSSPCSTPRARRPFPRAR